MKDTTANITLEAATAEVRALVRVTAIIVLGVAVMAVIDMITDAYRDVHGICPDVVEAP